jgi:hypothetical protein
MVRAAKSIKREALAIDFGQQKLDFNFNATCKHPVHPYGRLAYKQPFYPFLQSSKIKPKIIGNDEEITKFLVKTIKKGLRLIRSLVLDPSVDYLELKAVASIITTYLPERSRDQKTLSCHKSWNSFTRNLTRSIRRTTMFRLSVAAQEMGVEIPALKVECKALVNKLYKLIKGDTGNIKTRNDRKNWETSLETKPLKYIMVGTKFYTKL